MGTLQPADYSEVVPFKSAAARDHVSIGETRETHWFLWTDSGELVGLCGLMRTALGGRIKGVWVKPEFRGRGHGWATTLALIEHAVDELFYLRLEALALNPAFYEGLGWKPAAAERRGQAGAELLTFASAWRTHSLTALTPRRRMLLKPYVTPWRRPQTAHTR